MYSSARSAACRHAAFCGRRSQGASVAPVRKFFPNINTAPRWGDVAVRNARVRCQSTISEASQSTPKTTAEPLPKAKRPLYVRLPLTIVLSLLTFTLGFTMAAAPAAPTLANLASPPTDEETMSLFTPATEQAAAIEKAIFEHPLARSLMQDDKYIASRPLLKIPAQLRAQSLTGGTLMGEDKIEVPPLQFGTQDGSSFVSFQYIGNALCGHPGIIHGGLLATLLDEGLARCCFPALPNRVAVTASLKVDYKAPAMAGQVLVLRAETTRVEGRKAWVKGRLETLVDESKGEQPVVVTEAEALFIEPKMAKSMNLLKVQ
ncbi:hypothetical protein PMIN06_001599 [Paraphaeosphaeria minitans]|uniref:Thioesterase superfamily protein n=1 Tax=Paraphaeosphaeria minitans TaxID=565426 RepID=A0A9P6GS76_9PLEO|nr:thioesterase superfamily protein [Paraphaeosphaeria minitans]